MKILNSWFLKWRWKVAQAVEIRWWKKYLSDQMPEDYLAQKRAYWRRVLKQINLTFNKQDLILDAGCGPAGVFILLDPYKVHALDPLLDEYESRLEHFDRGKYPRTTFFNSQIEAFQSKHQYDKVFCLNAINHVEDIRKGFDQLAALTKKEGTLIVSIDAHNYWGFKFLFRLLPGDILHPHQYDVEEYKKMLEERGLRIIDCINLKRQFLFDYYIITAKK